MDYDLFLIHDLDLTHGFDLTIHDGFGFGT